VWCLCLAWMLVCMACHEASPELDVPEQPGEAAPASTPRPARLTIFLIDGSGSMAVDEGARLKALQAALQRPAVADALLPPESAAHAVMFYRFNNQVTPLGEGGIIVDGSSYQDVLQEPLLAASTGWSASYDAIETIIGGALEDAAVKEWREAHGADVHVILITDGFHANRVTDRCADNVPRLKSTMAAIASARSQQAVTVSALGLGEPALAVTLPIEVDSLCLDAADTLLDTLEKQGVDNRSLALLARAGGGHVQVATGAGVGPALEQIITAP